MIGISRGFQANLTERIEVLLGIRGKPADAAVRRRDLDKLVTEIMDRRAAARPEDRRTGANRNGQFVRLDTGDLLCWGRFSAAFAINVAYQGQYRSTERIWRFPAPFADANASVHVQPAYASGAGSYVIETLEETCRWSLTSAASQASAPRIVHFFAVGRAK